MSSSTYLVEYFKSEHKLCLYSCTDPNKVNESSEQIFHCGLCCHQYHDIITHTSSVPSSCGSSAFAWNGWQPCMKQCSFCRLSAVCIGARRKKKAEQTKKKTSNGTMLFFLFLLCCLLFGSQETIVAFISISMHTILNKSKYTLINRIYGAV